MAKPKAASDVQILLQLSSGMRYGCILRQRLMIAKTRYKAEEMRVSYLYRSKRNFSFSCLCVGLYKDIWFARQFIMLFLNDSFILRERNICAITGIAKSKDIASWCVNSDHFFVSARVWRVAHTSAVTHTLVTIIVVKKGATLTTSDRWSRFWMSFL